MGAISCWIESSVIKCEGHGGQRKRNIDEARNQYAQFHRLSSHRVYQIDGDEVDFLSVCKRLLCARDPEHRTRN